MKDIYKLCIKETENVFSSANKWLSFLQTAAWSYKYSFLEQVMIYAQDYPATACASPKIWSRLGRRVKDGVKMIALPDDLSENGVKYVCDIRNTEVVTPRTIVQWKLTEKYIDYIKNELKNAYGISGENIDEAIYNSILSIVNNSTPSSSRAERELLTVSATYQVLMRCDIIPNIELSKFQYITHLDTYEDMQRFGCELKEIAAKVLYHIGDIIKEADKYYKNERVEKNERFRREIRGTQTKLSQEPQAGRIFDALGNREIRGTSVDGGARV